MRKKTQFIVRKGDAYYLTTGKLLIYDPKDAKTEQQKKDVDKVAKEFQRIHDLPHTWYKAVQLDVDGFEAVNTSSSE